MRNPFFKVRQHRTIMFQMNRKPYTKITDSDGRVKKSGQKFFYKMLETLKTNTQTFCYLKVISIKNKTIINW